MFHFESPHKSALTRVVLQASALSTHNEEENLRRKLSELAGGLSDKGLSSDDEPTKKAFSAIKSPASTRSGLVVPLDTLKDKDLSSSSDEMPTEAQKVGVLLRWTASHSY